MRLFGLKGIVLIASVGLIIGAAGNLSQLRLSSVKAGDFDSNTLIDNATFQAADTMTTSDIQGFLSGKGSGLANFSEGGRSAAQIIYEAAHGHGEASGDFNGNHVVAHINPQVLLVTLQKEQGLVTEPNPSGDKLDCAMGYGATDAQGCKLALQQHPSWKGFTNQVEFAAWQLQWNYQRASLSNYNDFKVGQQMTFGDFNGNHTVTFNNAATAAEYRYTPHVYNGNYNFWKFMQSFFQGYDANIAGQSSYVTLDPGQPGRFWVRFKNVGTQTWTQSTVFLGTANPSDRTPGFTREDVLQGNISGWAAPNRIYLAEKSVAPGDVGTFIFYMTPPDDAKGGVFKEYFRPVASGIGWFGPEGVYWSVKVRGGNNGYTALWASQNDYPTVHRGDSFKLEVRYKNTGKKRWDKTGDGAVYLRTQNDIEIPYIREDRASGNPSGWLTSTRVSLQETSVAPGEYGTFTLWLTVPSDGEQKVHREHFELITKDGTLFPYEGEGTYWDVNIVQ